MNRILVCLLIFISSLVFCAETYAAKEVASVVSFKLIEMGDGKKLDYAQSYDVSYLYNSSDEESDFYEAVRMLDLPSGKKIKKFIIYIKTNSAKGRIYPYIGYSDYKTGAINYLTKHALDPNTVFYSNQGSEIMEIEVPLEITNHKVNNKKYEYFILFDITGGGGAEVAFYGAKVVTK